MEIIFLLIIVSLVFVAILAGVLFWAIRSGQFDDLEGHGHQILMDDDDVKTEDENTPQS
ncbi:MAG: cbb3-type cytochrome oxidase maturation protein [Gammaproteobacteria bacterium]|jgi:cbb3-type cytochrome oxidase maturation protein